MDYDLYSSCEKNRCMARTISHTILKIGQVNRQIYKVPHMHDAQKWSHSIRLVRPSAVIITHKT